MVARVELRRRWRGVGVLTLLIVIVAAIVLATASGARRSSTALSRFGRYSRASDLEIDVDRTTTPGKVAAFARSPGVASVAMLHAYAQQVDGYPNLQIAAALDGRIGSTVDRARLLAGRRQDPRRPYEVTISEGLGHLGVGSHLRAGSMTPDQLQQILEGHDPGPSRGPRIVLHVVGIVRRPLDLGDRAATGGVVILTPAFAHRFAGRIGVFLNVLRVRTVHGQADLARVSTAARRAFGSSGFFQIVDLARENGGAESAIDVVTLALWIFAGVTALAGAIAVGIVLTRETSQASGDHPTLRSLGMTRGARIAISMIPACVALGVGSAGRCGRRRRRISPPPGRHRSPRRPEPRLPRRLARAGRRRRRGRRVRPRRRARRPRSARRARSPTSHRPRRADPLASPPGAAGRGSHRRSRAARA